MHGKDRGSHSDEGWSTVCFMPSKRWASRHTSLSIVADEEAVPFHFPLRCLGNSSTRTLHGAHVVDSPRSSVNVETPCHRLSRVVGEATK